MKSIVTCTLVSLWIAASTFAAVESDHLVLELSGALPGGDPAAHWVPTIGLGSGQLDSEVNPVIPNIDENYPRYDSTDKFFAFNQSTTNGGATVVQNAGGAQVEGLGTDLNFDYTDTFTLEAWVRPAGVNSDQSIGRAYLLGTQRKNGQGLRLNIRDNDDGNYGFEFTFRDNTSPDKTQLIWATPREIPFGQWVHVVMVYDGGATAGDPAVLPSGVLYVDGTAKDSSIQDPPPGDWPNNNPDFQVTEPDNPFVIGMRDISTNTFTDEDRWPYEGDIAAVRVYDTALTEQQVADNFGAGRSAAAGVDPGNPSAIVLNGLVLWAEASDPGTSPDAKWAPIVGCNEMDLYFTTDPNTGGLIYDPCGLGPYRRPLGGTLYNVQADPDQWFEGAFLPTYHVEDAQDPNHPQDRNYFYRFTGQAGAGGGMAHGYTTDALFDYSDDFTVEAWFRIGPPECIDDPECSFTSPNERMYLVGDSAQNDTGWRLNVRRVSPALSSMEFIMRDNFDGSAAEPDAAKETWRFATGSQFASGTWYYVAFTYDGTDMENPQDDGQYYSSVTQGPHNTVYSCSFCDADGTLERYYPGSGLPTIFAEPDFVQFPDPDDWHHHGQVNIGMRSQSFTNFDRLERMAFIGDIAVVRIYDRLLSADEIEHNMQAGMARPQRMGDIDLDTAVDLKDFALIHNAWLASTGQPQYNESADLDASGVIGINDLSVLAGGWLQVTDHGVERCP